MKKRFLAVVLAMVVMLCSAVPALAAAPDLEKADYEGRGYVEVDFRTRVQYKNVEVQVMDAAGKPLAVRITEKDDDDMTFYVKGLKPGKAYTFTISGIRNGRSGSYGMVTGTFKTPKNELSVRKAVYDRRDKELNLEFYGRVQYKNPKVVIKDATGKTYPCQIEELDRDEMELAVTSLPKGKYTVKISGIRLQGDQAYTSIVKTFWVR